MNRKQFIYNTILATTGLSMPFNNINLNEKHKKLTILHTNDMHSQIFPFKSGKYKGLGGMAERATLIKSLRQKTDNVLLLDAGDIFQGTPYFNYFGGELEFKLMSKMNYDAATLGNHDFDNGISGLNDKLRYAKFSFINSNYDFSNTTLNGKIKKFKIFRKDQLKVGVFGLGVELDGLVQKKLYEGVKYYDPIEVANEVSSMLKFDYKCDMIVCLSHLGLEYEDEKVSDLKVAKNSSFIDLIIGGHTHSFLENSIFVTNQANKKVVVSQAGYGGIKLGRLDFIFNKKNEISKVISTLENIKSLNFS